MATLASEIQSSAPGPTPAAPTSTSRARSATRISRPPGAAVGVHARQPRQVRARGDHLDPGGPRLFGRHAHTGHGRMGVDDPGDGPVVGLTVPAEQVLRQHQAGTRSLASSAGWPRRQLARSGWMFTMCSPRSSPPDGHQIYPLLATQPACRIPVTGRYPRRPAWKRLTGARSADKVGNLVASMTACAAHKWRSV